MNEKQKKLVLVQDMVNSLEKQGIVISSSAVRSRLRASMYKLAQESCKALGIDMNSEQIERISNSRLFQEAVASVLKEED